MFGHAPDMDAAPRIEPALPVDSRAVDTPPDDRPVERARPRPLSLVRTVRPLLAALLLATLAAAPALAHAELESSNPDDGAQLTTAPTAVSLTFTEGLTAAKSSLVLEGPDGEVGTARPEADGASEIRLDGLTLAPGAYTIRWTAAADDGHIERGTTTFTIAEPTAPPATAGAAPSATPSASPPAPSAGAAPTPAPSAGPTDPAASGGDVLLPIVAALALVGVIGFLVLRRSRTA
jgi:methionine-rich copper-binding protein CopC